MATLGTGGVVGAKGGHLSSFNNGSYRGHEAERGGASAINNAMKNLTQ